MWLPRPGPFPDATFAYDEPFTYANGNLTGNGNWTTSTIAPDGSAKIVSNHLVNDASKDNANANAVAIAGSQPDHDWTVIIDVLAPTLSTSTTAYFWIGDPGTASWYNLTIATTTGQTNKVTITMGTNADSFDSGLIAMTWNAAHAITWQKVGNVLIVTIDAGTPMALILTAPTTDTDADIYTENSGTVQATSLYVDRLRFNQG